MERERSSAQGWRSVGIVLAGAFMALLDTTIVNVALPTIRSGLHAPASTLEWIVSGYALAYGLALVPAGRAGDRFGQKPMFVGGLTVFTLASVGCGISRTPAEIVTARVIQGLGAGTFYPAISATIQLAFTGPARSKAFGMLSAVIGVSTALGPTLGGLIIAAAGSADGRSRSAPCWPPRTATSCRRGWAGPFWSPGAWSCWSGWPPPPSSSISPLPSRTAGTWSPRCSSPGSAAA